MIFADKLINERKKNGWSQEELAEKLNVSRQAVSKWEGAQAIPDIQRVIDIAELFNVTTDYLLKDEYEPQDFTSTRDMPVNNEIKQIRKVTLQEANEFLEIEKDNAYKIAFGVLLCILSPVTLICLVGLADDRIIKISENTANGIGVGMLLLMVALAAFIFIRCGIRSEKYKFMESDSFETEYGVDGMVSEKKKEYQHTKSTNISIGVVLCIIASVPMIVVSPMGVKDYIICLLVGIMLVFIAIGVNRIVTSKIIWLSYEKLLQENDYSAREKAKTHYVGSISGIYWAIAIAIYLVWGFITNDWGRTWILWPIAGVCFPVVRAITKALTKEK